MSLSKEKRAFARAEILARCNIFDVARDLGYSIGHDNKISCPIKPEKTPSFQLYHDNKFYCFGCRTSGNSIGLVMHGMGLSYEAALLYLCDRHGIILPDDSDDISESFCSLIARKLDDNEQCMGDNIVDYDTRFAKLMALFQERFEFVYKNDEASCRLIQELHELAVTELDYRSNKDGKTHEQYQAVFNEIEKELDKVHTSIKEKINSFKSEFNKMKKCQDCFAGATCPASSRAVYHGSVHADVIVVGDCDTDISKVEHELGVKENDILFIPAFICGTMTDFPGVSQSDFLKCFSKYAPKMIKISNAHTIVFDARYSHLEKAIANPGNKKILSMESLKEQYVNG